ncbi:MAG TPA: long-chain fatty acid--CoA ligase, partial [Syntrophomonas sp.]|nr:long-chain fatty acid--CoA ligase [Syntrophomonas sp.]
MSNAIANSSIDWDQEFEAYLKENKTLAYMMLKKAEEFADFDALKHKVKGQWVSIKWKDFGEQVRAVAKALLEMDLQPGEMAGIFSANRAEWAIADLGILAIRSVSVPIYATNSAEEAAHIVNDAGIKILFVGEQEQYDRAKKVMADSACLEKIVAFDRDIVISGDDSMYFDELLAIGRKSAQDATLQERLNEVNPDDILTLIYTSGTTGKPKGAIHTHRSFMNGIFPSSRRFLYTGPQHVSLAILPLSHVFERMWSYGCMSMGICIAYCPDPKQFVEVMADIRPHFMTSVPRIWEKVYGTIHEGLKTASPAKAKLFNWAERIALEVYRNKTAGIKSGALLRAQHALADALIMKKVRQTLGAENCDVYHVGGAAFASEINEFFLAFGINIIQGFGLTEFFPVCVGFDDYGRPGECGPMIPMVEARVSDEGEIQLKGGMCMQGYYNNPEATADCFTEDGWFKTQDIGEIKVINKDGTEFTYIKITDRIKDLIITAGGKNISPQQIETRFGEDLFIEQFVVIGEKRPYITALIVPNFVILEDYCQRNNIQFSSHEDLVAHPAVIKLYDDIIAKHNESMARVEQIKKFTLLTNELTQEAGELTPTMKLKRKQI